MSNRLFNIGKGFTQRRYDLLWANEDPTAEFSGMVMNIDDIRTRYPILAVVSLDSAYYYQKFEDIDDDGSTGNEDLVRETTTMIFTKPDSHLLIQSSDSGDGSLTSTTTTYNFSQQITGLHEQHLYYRNVVLESVTQYGPVFDATTGGYVNKQHTTHALRISSNLYNQSGNAVSTDEAQKRYIVPLYIYGIRGKGDDE